VAKDGRLLQFGYVLISWLILVRSAPPFRVAFQLFLRVSLYSFCHPLSSLGSRQAKPARVRVRRVWNDGSQVITHSAL
jgi:hypothetical protein